MRISTSPTNLRVQPALLLPQDELAVREAMNTIGAGVRPLDGRGGGRGASSERAHARAVGVRVVDGEVERGWRRRRRKASTNGSRRILNQSFGCRSSFP